VESLAFRPVFYNRCKGMFSAFRRRQAESLGYLTDKIAPGIGQTPTQSGENPYIKAVIPWSKGGLKTQWRGWSGLQAAVRHCPVQAVVIARSGETVSLWRAGERLVGQPWNDRGAVLKVVVFGATGRVGRAVALMLLAKGHEVTAFVRDPSQLPTQAAIPAIVGDAENADDVAKAVAGHDAVVVALGDSRNPVLLRLGWKPLSSPNICEKGTANVIAAAKAAGVRRLVCVTSYGVGDTRALLSETHKRIFDWLQLTAQMDDKERQEALVKASDLDWTLLQPVGLTDGAATGRWLASVTGQRRKRTISRVDLAAFIIDTLLVGGGNKRETVVLSGLPI